MARAYDFAYENRLKLMKIHVVYLGAQFFDLMWDYFSLQYYKFQTV